jgi:hypothetical protein
MPQGTFLKHRFRSPAGYRDEIFKIFLDADCGLLGFETAIVSAVSSASTFHPEERNSKFLRNISTYLQDRFALHSRRQRRLYPELRTTELYI